MMNQDDLIGVQRVLGNNQTAIVSSVTAPPAFRMTCASPFSDQQVFDIGFGHPTGHDCQTASQLDRLFAGMRRSCRYRRFCITSIVLQTLISELISTLILRLVLAIRTFHALCEYGCTSSYRY